MLARWRMLRRRAGTTGARGYLIPTHQFGDFSLFPAGRHWRGLEVNQLENCQKVVQEVYHDAVWGVWYAEFGELYWSLVFERQDFPHGKRLGSDVLQGSVCW